MARMVPQWRTVISSKAALDASKETDAKMTVSKRIFCMRRQQLAPLACRRYSAISCTFILIQRTTAASLFQRGCAVLDLYLGEQWHLGGRCYGRGLGAGGRMRVDVGAPNHGLYGAFLRLTGIVARG